MADLSESLASSLSGSYTIERELGGGGMSRVFVAEEIALGRQVVVKVLAPDIAHALSTERFVREIKVAARLQQANIVPVLRAGEIDGLPYYTMPLVRGESLRARLQQGRIPSGDAIAILRDVAKALAYAHAEGIVHRDIKPENVLLSGGTAVVTDFGIAKAISASREVQDVNITELTSVGTSLGTPAYMSPEQAAGDPSTDARADLYAWGIMAYEMLAGRHPFAQHTTLHELIRAQMTAMPEHLGVRSPDVPLGITTIVMQCLAKAPSERPASASELIAALDIRHVGGAAAPTAPRLGVWSALGIHAAATLVVAVIAKLAIVLIGLPAWVFAGSIGVMLVGLPIVLLTALIERQRGRQVTPSAATLKTIARLAERHPRRFTWRRTTIGGAIALGGFVVLVVAYMTLRQLGIGPFGSLIGAKALTAQDRILIADLRGPASDTGLGSVFAEGLRAALSESKTVRLIQPERATAALARMEKKGVPITGAVAKEVAERAGAKAILDGDVRSVGKAYTLTARLLTPGGDEPLATLQESASSDADFTAATGRLAKRLRERIGESLRTVNAAPHLEDVTTSSLPALRKFTEATQSSRRGDYYGAIRLYREAAAIDTGFALAYAAAGGVLAPYTGMRQTQSELVARAYAARARATPEERRVIEYSYWDGGPTIDYAKADSIAMAGFPLDSVRWSFETAFVAHEAHDYRTALQRLRLGLERDSVRASYLIAVEHAELGMMDSAKADVDMMRAKWPMHPLTMISESQLAFRIGDDSVALRMARAAMSLSTPPFAEWGAIVAEGYSIRYGQLREARKFMDVHMRARQARGLSGTRRDGYIRSALYVVQLARDSALTSALLDSAVSVDPWEATPPRERDWQMYGRVAWLAHRPDLVRRALEGARRDDPGGGAVPLLEALQLAGEGKYRDAIDRMRLARGPLSEGRSNYLALLFDLAGMKDSARVSYERFVNSTSIDLTLWNDGRFGVPARRRLGEMYEERGEFDKAYHMYESIAQRWQHADAALQPQVAEVRARMARLESRRAK